MRITDTHAHLETADSRGLLSFVKECAEGGVTAAVVPALSGFPKGLDEPYSDGSVVVLPCAGFHPWYLPSKDPKICSDAIKNWFCDNNISIAAAIGECGLDAVRSDIPMDAQIAAFNLQLRIASESAKPVILHCVRAFSEVSASLRDSAYRGKLLAHGFSGSKEIAMSWCRNETYFGIGFRAFRAPQKIKELIAAVGIGRIVLETDSPYQALSKFPGQGSPKELLDILRQTAKLADVSEETLAEAVETNARSLFDSLSRASSSV